MGIFREFWKTRMGKAQIVSEAAWGVAICLTILLRSNEAAIILMPIGAGIIGVFVCVGYWKDTGKVKK